MIHNAYPEKTEVPFRRTPKEMGVLIDIIRKAPYPVEVKRVAYVVIRNEGGAGKSVINDTNACGAQGDGGRWPPKFDKIIVATCVKRENKRVDGTGGDIRRFLVFDKLENCIAFVCDRLHAKGVYIGSNGGKNHKQPVKTKEDLADAYEDEWVYGEDHKTKPIEAKPFISMYKQAEKIFG